MKHLVLAIMVSLSAPSAVALQDPTRPPASRSAPAEVAPVTEYRLASIIISPRRRVAIVDGVPRQEGETFENVRLRRIFPDRVELVVDGQVRILRLAAPPQVRSIQ